MPAVLAEIALYLENEIPSLTQGENLFAVEMPPDPDQAVCLYEYDGQGEMDTMGTDDASFDVWFDTRIQVQSRAISYTAAKGNADNVDDVLTRVLDNDDVGGGPYHRIRGLGSWMVLEIDSKARVRLKRDYEVIRARG